MGNQIFWLYLALYKHLKALILKFFGWKRSPIADVLRMVESSVVRNIVIKTTPNPVLWNRLTLFWDLDTWWHVRTLLAGHYEPHILPLFMRLVSKGSTVVDVGAHLGIYTLVAADLVKPTGRVYAFEPDPRVYPLLCRNVAANGYTDIVKTLPLALSDKVETGPLFLSPASGSSSMSSRWAGSGRSVDVQFTTLDDFFEHEGWPAVDLVKIDVEGAEILVLRGMKELSRRNPHLKVLCEFNPDAMEASHVTCEELLDTLRYVGLSRLFLIDIDCPEPQLVTGDLLASVERILKKRHHSPHILALRNYPKTGESGRIMVHSS